MNTTHYIYFRDSTDLSFVEDESVDLIVTSPPYPMVKMWDCLTSETDIYTSLHSMLDKVWKECYRVLKPGSFMCVNIGDAVRTVDEEFRLFNNTSRIVSCCTNLGFLNMPNIVWKKPTNAPNKFMGSGMLPCGAYVTLEHENILIFKKPGKRQFCSDEERLNRRQSCYFWEERNKWFSDIWEITGTGQNVVNSQTRVRNASFPLKVPYRLINMFSVYNDVVLDPFFGLGTTMNAAVISGRNCIEIDKELSSSIQSSVMSIETMNDWTRYRLEEHIAFMEQRKKQTSSQHKHFNNNIDCPVMTNQETDMQLYLVDDFNRSETNNNDMLKYKASYFRLPVSNKLI